MDYTLLTFSGRLTDDPQLRKSGDTSICKFTVACNKRLTNGDERTSFIPTTVFGKQAEICNEYLSKGREVRVVGELETDSYVDSEGVKRKGFGCIVGVTGSVDFGSGGRKTDDKETVVFNSPGRPSTETTREKIFKSKYPARRRE